MPKRILVHLGALLILAIAPCGRSAETKQTHSGAPIPPATLTTSVARQAAPNQPALKQRNPRYQLCKSDVLEVDLPMTPEFNQTVTVQPDGYVMLLGAGDIHVEGQTIPEFIESVKAAYHGILHDPVIAVHVKDFEKPYFIAGGEVGHPGKYELRGDITAVEAVSIAGGFTDSSKHSEVWLFRRVSNDWVETKELNIKKMLNAGNLSEDLHLHPGDMLYVPKSTIGKIRRYLPVATLGSYFNPVP